MNVHSVFMKRKQRFQQGTSGRLFLQGEHICRPDIVHAAIKQNPLKGGGGGGGEPVMDMQGESL